MHAPQFLVELLLLIAFAAVGVAVFERLRLPAIVAFLVIGALAGPGGLGLISDPDRVRELAELGVVFLLFEIGLELPIDRLRALWRSAFVAGALQVTVTLLAVAGLAMQLGLASNSAWVVGALVALSSTALVMRLLVERGEVDAPHGQLSVGILLFQDLCVVPFLLAIPILAGEAGGSLAAVGMAVFRATAALAVFAAVVRFVLPTLLDRVARLGSREVFTLVALLVVVGSAVGAESIGLTLAVGAFIGGLVTSASPYAHQLFAELVPLRGVFLGLFFTAVGMLFDPRIAASELPAVLGFVGGVLLLKTAVVVGVVQGVLGLGRRIALQTGLTLAQSGEFSFVLAAAAAGAGLLDDRTYQVFVAGSVVTLIATPFLVRAAPGLAKRWTRRSDRAPARAAALDVAADSASHGDALQDHALVIGYGIAGRTLTRVLRLVDIPYRVIDANGRSVRQAQSAGEPVIYGDATRRLLLDRLGVGRARLVAVAISDPVATREVVGLVREMAPGTRILARTRYVLAVDELAQAGADVVVAEEYEATIDLVSETLRAIGVPDGAIGRFTQELREEGYGTLRDRPGLALDPWLAELLQEVTTEWVEVPEPCAVTGSLSELDLRQRTGVNVLGLEREGRMIPNPDADQTIRAGDRLLVIGSPNALERLGALLRAPATGSEGS